MSSVTYAATRDPKSKAALVVFVGEGSQLSAGAKAVEEAGSGQLGRALKAANFTGKKGKLLEILAQSGTSFSEVLASYRTVIFVLLVFASALLVAALVFLVIFRVGAYLMFGVVSHEQESIASKIFDFGVVLICCPGMTMAYLLGWFRAGLLKNKWFLQRLSSS